TRPMNRTPAINSEVPIGYRINGDEMLSFMPTTGEGLAHLVPKAGSALMARGCAFPQIFQADVRRMESGAARWRAAYRFPESLGTERAACSFDLRPIDTAFAPSRRPLDTEIALQNLRLRLDFLGRPLVHDVAVVDDVDALRQRQGGGQVLLDQ